MKIPSKIRLIRKKENNRIMHRKGFTMVELIVVLVILAILLAVAIPAVLGYIDNAKEKKYIVQAEAALTSTQAALTEIYNDGNNRLTPSRRAKAEEEAGFEEGKTSFTVWTESQLVDGQTDANSDHMASYTVAFAKFVAEDMTVVVYKDNQWTVYANEAEAKEKPDESTPGALSDDDEGEVTGCVSNNIIYVWRVRTQGTPIVAKGDDSAYDPASGWDADTHEWRDEDEFSSHLSIAVTFHGKPLGAEDDDDSALAFNDLEGNTLADDEGNYTLVFDSVTKFANEYSKVNISVTDRRYSQNEYKWNAPLLSSGLYPKSCFQPIENRLSEEGVLDSILQKPATQIDVYPELTPYELNVPVLFTAYDSNTLTVAAKAEGGQDSANRITFKINMVDSSRKIDVGGVTTNTENFTVDVSSAIKEDKNREEEDKVATFDENWRVKKSTGGTGASGLEDVVLPMNSTSGDSVQARIDDYLSKCEEAYRNNGTLPTGKPLEFVAAADIHKTVYFRCNGEDLLVFTNGEFTYDVTFKKHELSDEIYDVDHNRLVVKGGELVNTGSNPYSFLNFISRIEKLQTSTVSRDNVIKEWQLFGSDKEGNKGDAIEGGIKKDRITTTVFSHLYADSSTDGEVACAVVDCLTGLLLPNDLVSQYTGTNQDHAKLGDLFQKLAAGDRSKIRSVSFVDPRKREDYKDLAGFSGDICISKTTLESVSETALAVDADGEFKKVLVDEEYPSYIVAYSIKVQEDGEDRYDICVFSEDGSDMKAMNSLQSCFKDCSNMRTNDFVEHIETSSVTRFKQMFSGCESLVSLNLNGFDITHSTDESSMFENCRSLGTLEFLGGFDTKNCRYFEYMFKNCASLTVAPVIDISVGYDVKEIFSGCSSLPEVTFVGAGTEVEGNLGRPGNNTRRSGNKNIENALAGCTNLKKVTIRDLWIPLVEGNNVLESDRITSFAGFFAFDALRKGDTNDPNKNGVEEIRITNVKLPTAGENFAKSLFYGYVSLRYVDLNGFVIGTDTRNSFNMQSMFNGCKKLSVENEEAKTYLNMTGFIRDDMVITNTNSMFNGCESLTTALIPGFYSTEKGIPTRNSEDTGSMFKGCKNLTNVGGDVYVDNTKSINSMFYNCQKLSEIKLIGSASGSQTTVTDTSVNTFYGCIGAQKIWVQNISAPQVTSLESLFDGCTVLKNVDISTFNTGVLTNTKKMFHDCKALTGQNNTENDECFNLGTLDLSSVENMYAMFQNCSSLNVDMELNISSATDIRYIFNGCTSLKKVTIVGAGTDAASACPLSNVTDAFKTTGIEEFLMKDLYFERFSSTSADASQLQTLMSGLRGAMDASSNPCLKVVIFDNVKMPGQTSYKDLFNGAKALRYVDLSRLETGTITNTANMFKNCEQLRGCNKKKNDEDDVFEHYFSLNALNLRNVETMYSMFEGCSNLECVPNSIYTVNAKSMAYMFKNCSSTLFKNAGTIRIDSATNLLSLFDGCSNLNTVILSGAKGEDGTLSICTVTNDNIRYMFNATKIKDLTIQNIEFQSLTHVRNSSSNLNTSGALYYILIGTKSYLQNLTFSDVTFTKIEAVDYVLSGYKSLKKVNWINVKAPKLKRMKALFQDDTSLTDVTLYPINVPLLENLGLSFKGCSVLENVNFGSYGDAGAMTVPYMIYLDEMFRGCGELTTVDLSAFNPTTGLKTAYMFDGCIKLTTIITSPENNNEDGIVSSKITQGSTDMFKNCIALSGGNGTVYSASYVDRRRAYVDKSGRPGYFTEWTAEP